ncbi:MAG: hypothetical protein A2033_07825 [Bacteroidetes bacterium GWA2_31_9]|nr:MAG: hypothetical protein A2033_07825 [Bacteroidetes bacterium GWA2_31_9]
MSFARIRKLIFLLFYWVGLNSLLYKLKKKNNSVITILCFHRISDEFDFAYPPLKTNIFEKISCYIIKNYEVVDIFKINKPTKKPKIILTFDDGYKDFIENALPILKKYKMTAIQSVVVDALETGAIFWTQRLNNIINYLFENKCDLKIKTYFLNIDYRFSLKTINNFKIDIFKILLNYDSKKREKILNYLENAFPLIDKKSKIKMMSWDDMKICIENNIQIASHSYSHSVLSNLEPDRELDIELFESKRIIEEKLNIKVDIFTFPNGVYNDNIVNQLIENGYIYSLTTEDTFYKLSSGTSHKILPRIQIYSNDYYENILKINGFHNFFHKY